MKIIRLALLHTTIFIVVFLFSKPLFAQADLPLAMNWLTFEQVKTRIKENPLPVMVFFYKTNNDSSMLMLNTTFTRKEVCSYSNSKYYAVKFDVSSKADITFMDGKIYKKDPAKPYHSLATMLLGDKPEVPTVLLYDDQNNGFSFKGFRKSPDLICMLVYISENIQKTTKYEIWAPAYFRTFPPDKKANYIPLVVNWLPLNEALKRNQENPKGIFLTFYSKSNAASSVMLVSAFSHNKVAAYLNDNFYCVRIDAQTSDTLTWDKTYYNKHESGNYHELATTMMKNKMQFPSIFYLDASNKLIMSENSYLSPEALYILSNYIVSDSYKTKSLTQFIKTFNFEFNDIAPREHQNSEIQLKH